MESALKNLFAVTDLRNRVLFTLALLGVYRIGSHIPTPGVNTEALAIMAEQTRNTMFGLYDMFSGGNLSAEGGISSQQQLLTCLSPCVERPGDLSSSKGPVVEQPTIFSCERNSLSHTLINDVVADFGKTVDVCLSRAVIATFDGIVK